MNSYIQDTIPIYITLSYDHYFLKFPINPESIRKEIGSASNTAEIEGLGQVSLPKTPDLARITIESFFWHETNSILGFNLTPAFMYVNWLEKWQKSKKPANLIVTRLNYSMQVTCENFSHEIRAGEEEDVYYTLELQEYRPHKAKKIGISDDETLLQKIQNITGEAFSPVLVDIPLPTRNSTRKKSYTNPYICAKNETLCTITKKITGSSDDWKSLYDENKSELGDMLEDGDNITESTKLTLPQSWVDNSSYNIIQGVT